MVLRLRACPRCSAAVYRDLDGCYACLRCGCTLYSVGGALRLPVVGSEPARTRARRPRRSQQGA